eukprot:CAMPEP_0197877822 /NCGR_PEP_ID=MMETSP1439-20131203/6404_1 /TAXON_ID=66791 /ORGANISM="Gonyaulax spinifera, Strain CCMP409" /LENGTH=219 /DNA_ID=CAMNT_0043497199 /DNA_START=80 /DNA_END=739 /DNA_ORIENTATION=+
MAAFAGVNFGAQTVRRRRWGLAAAACGLLLAAQRSLPAPGETFVASPILAGRSVSVARRAEDGGLQFGHVLASPGVWEMTTDGVEQDEKDKAAATKSWEAFQKQFKGASERGMYMDTPVAEQDVKYRFLRLKNTFGITPEQALKMMETDALPMVIDSDYVKGTFDAMVAGASREKALEIVDRHPGVLASGKDIKGNMMQADIISNMIAATRPLAQLFKR